MNREINLEQLRREWAALGEQLGNEGHVDGSRLRRELGSKTFAAIRPVGYVTVFEVACNLAMVALLTVFAVRHAGEPRLLVSALSLLLAWISLTATGIWQYVSFRRLDMSGPVAVVQMEIATLTAVRVGTLKWLALFAPLLWIPLAIVGAEALWGIDLTRAVMPGTFIANLVFWAGWAAGLVLAARYYRRPGKRSSLIGRIADELAGQGLLDGYDYAGQAGLIDEIGFGGFPAATEESPEAADDVVRPQVARLVYGLVVLIAGIVGTGLFIAGNVHDAQAVVTGIVVDMLLLGGVLGIAWQLAGRPNASIMRRRRRFVAIGVVAVAPLALAAFASLASAVWLHLPPFIMVHPWPILTVTVVWAGLVATWVRFHLLDSK